MNAEAERPHQRVDAAQSASLVSAGRPTAAIARSFVSAAAIEAAAGMLADRRLFALSPAAWRIFDEALLRPAADVPGLADMMAEETVLDAQEGQ